MSSWLFKRNERGENAFACDRIFKLSTFSQGTNMSSSPNRDGSEQSAGTIIHEASIKMGQESLESSEAASVLPRKVEESLLEVGS